MVLPLMVIVPPVRVSAPLPAPKVPLMPGAPAPFAAPATPEPRPEISMPVSAPLPPVEATVPAWAAVVNVAVTPSPELLMALIKP